MAKTLGTVISTFEGPSTSRLDFVLKERLEPVSIRKGQFVQVKTEEGILIARVDEIIKTNRYFMQAEAVSEYEKSGKPLPEVFPVDRWEYLMAKATPLGIYAGGLTLRTTYPPSPGNLVEEIDKDILSDFLGFDAEKGLNIGKLAFHDVVARLNITKLFQKHLAILATSGAGKSHTVSILIEELLNRPEELGKPAIILLDPHGEYLGFSKDPNHAERTRVFDKKSINIGLSFLSSYQLMEFLPEISPVQARELTKIIYDLKTKKKTYGFNDLITAVEVNTQKKATRDTTISWLLNLESTGLFSKTDKPSPQELTKPGQLTILDLSDFTRLKEKQILVAHFARKLFNLRKEEKIPPFILVIEEAHQFCPEGAKREKAISRGIIETIAREGRKFHASLVLISQRPIQLSTTALSQCNTNILLRIVNPYDLDHIGKSSEGITSDVLKIMPGLNVGEALIVGEAVNYPIMVRIRERKSKRSEKEVRLEDALVKYARKMRDLDAFM